MTEMADIEAWAKVYADAQRELGFVVDETRLALDVVMRRRMTLLRRRSEAAATARAALARAVLANPRLFEKPRTLVFHGIRCGLTRSKPSVEIANEKRTVGLIKKHLPDLYEALVKVEEKPLKTAMNGLKVADLKRIGCSLTLGRDDVVIKVPDDRVTKLAKAFLKDAAPCEPSEQAEA